MDRSIEIINAIREVKGEIASDVFFAVCQAVLFYMKGNFSNEQIANMVIEEVYP